MPKTIDYNFIRGDTKQLKKFKLKTLDGAELKLTDSDQIYFTMKNASDIAVLKKKIDQGITLGDDGFYHITIEANETSNLDIGSYNYDIEVDLFVSNKTYVSTIIQGEITLEKDITTEGDR